MDLLTTLVLSVICTVLFIYTILKQKYAYWKELNVPYLEPNILFGNLTNVIIFQKPLTLSYLQMYEELAPHKFGGVYLLQKPALILRDPELIKNVVIKDFHYFYDRALNIDIREEPLAQNLFIVQGQQWRNLRLRMIGTFTSGKMKALFPLMADCAKRLQRLAADFAEKKSDIDMKTMLSRFSIDLIGTCAFGLDTSSIEDPDSEFQKMTAKVFAPRFIAMIRSFGIAIPKVLNGLLDVKVFPEQPSKFFSKIVQDTVEYREKNCVKRNDFLDIMMTLRTGGDKEKTRKNGDVKYLEQLLISDKSVGKAKLNSEPVEMTLELIAAQCMQFFSAGFDATATVTSLALLEIAQNADIKQKLQDEIDRVFDKYNSDEVKYDMLKEFKYLDMVICETSRKYPVAARLERICTKDYCIPETEVVIKKGTIIIIPLVGLHMDQQYYQNPHKFNPENFSEEAKSQRDRFTYLPFGEGPRNCIAERFAVISIKVALIYLMKFSFQLSTKTRLPLKFKTNTNILSLQDVIWLKCNKR